MLLLVATKGSVSVTLTASSASTLVLPEERQQRPLHSQALRGGRGCTLVSA